jgi:hypothetical protein
MSFTRIGRAFAARWAGALAFVLVVLSFAVPAEAAYKVRLDYVRTAPGNQPAVFFGTENVSGAGSTPVISLGRSDLTLGGLPASAQVRVTVLSGAVVMTLPASSPTGGETKGLRLQAGDQPIYVPIANAQVMAFTEAADGPTSTGGSAPSGTGGVSTWAADGGNNALLTSTVVQVASGAHSLYGVALWNNNSSDVFCQVFDAAPGSVVLGTTKPKFPWRVPGGSVTNAGAWEEKYNGEGRLAFSTAISIACTTTATGNTAPTNGVQANFYYQ